MIFDSKLESLSSDLLLDDDGTAAAATAASAPPVILIVVMASPRPIGGNISGTKNNTNAVKSAPAALSRIKFFGAISSPRYFVAIAERMQKHIPPPRA